MKKYEFIEHTADVAIRAFGRSVEESFASAATALFDIITDDSPINPEMEVEFTIEADDRDSLLVRFLSHLIAYHEIHNIVLTSFEVVFQGGCALRATARGEKFSGERHEYGLHVKGVSYHMLEIVEGSDSEPGYVQVLFDV